jgi:uncharacterized integral membrane protein
MFFLILVVLLLIGGGVTLIAVQNFAQSVHLNIFAWQSPDLPVGLWLMMVFLLGVVLLYAIAFLSSYNDRNIMKKLRQQIQALEEVQVTSLKQENVSLPEPTTEDRKSSASTGSLLIPMPGINLPQVGGEKRAPAPLLPPQNFHQ